MLLVIRVKYASIQRAAAAAAAAAALCVAILLPLLLLLAATVRRRTFATRGCSSYLTAPAVRIVNRFIRGENTKTLVHPLAVHSLLCGLIFYLYTSLGPLRSHRRMPARRGEAPLVLGE